MKHSYNCYATFYGSNVYCSSISDDWEPFIREIQPEEAWKYRYPVTPSYFPGLYLWFFITVVPVLLFLFEYLTSGKLTNILPMFMALSLAYPLNGFLTSVLKTTVGRPRPDFHFRCFPNGEGTDYKHCRGDPGVYLDGRRSFPSGHASFAFCCMLFTGHYLARKLRQWAKAPQLDALQVCAYFFPLILSTLIAVSRTCDYHHHYEDVLFGALIGSLISHLSFKLYFPEKPKGRIIGVETSE